MWEQQIEQRRHVRVARDREARHVHFQLDREHAARCEEGASAGEHLDFETVDVQLPQPDVRHLLWCFLHQRREGGARRTVWHTSMGEQYARA
eukprot:6873766-Prymnesium_polylepis.1